MAFWSWGNSADSQHVLERVAKSNDMGDEAGESWGVRSGAGVDRVVLR